MSAKQPIHIIGGGLAGSEAAWQLAQREHDVVLHEMRPVRGTAAHRTEKLGELVCSATNQALQQIREMQMSEMQQLTGGINLPGLSDTLAGMGLRRS